MEDLVCQVLHGRITNSVRKEKKKVPMRMKNILEPNADILFLISLSPLLSCNPGQTG